MPRNVELKARGRDLARAERVAERLSGGAGRALTQTDTFLRAPRGRLKLRDFGDGRGQLIFYERPDSEGPKLSHYSISPTADPAGLVEPDLLLVTSGAQRCLQCQGRQEACRCAADQELPEAVLSQALGVQGVVKKERRLYVVGQTRVHLDRVEGLGDFLELEVVLSEQQSPEDGERVARRLMEELGVQEEDLVAGAYLDLLLAEGSPT